MLTDLHPISPRRLSIKVKPAAERMVRKEHPWVFEDSIVKQSQDGKAGDLAIIYDQKKNKLMAIGLYDPFSPIRIKVLQFKKPATINQEWFQNKIEEAFQKRQSLLETDTNSYRLIHGENDGLPGLVADVYDQVLVVKLYSLIWKPFLRMIFPQLLDTSGCQTLVLRLSRQLQELPQELPGLHDGQVLQGALEKEEVIFKEHGLLFSANPVKGHKTGYFLDHRHNRKRVGELAEGKKVLDVFAYAGGFSVHALAGGAREVTSLDISSQALEMARQNVRLNFGEDAHHKIMSVDAFEGMEQLIKKKKPFDLIIIDPPSFAKRASERERALQKYAQLTALGIQLLSEQGILVMASCSSRVSAADFFEKVLERARQSGRPFQEMERHLHDVDHPIGFPEGAYLKCIYLQFAAS
jgi:23S rRNA (cytosine1962-C5)-methyltransferase